LAAHYIRVKMVLDITKRPIGQNLVIENIDFLTLLETNIFRLFEQTFQRIESSIVVYQVDQFLLEVLLTSLLVQIYIGKSQSKGLDDLYHIREIMGMEFELQFQNRLLDDFKKHP
jgi:hypothetical protein